ncbi:MAG: hypothetical protein HY815_06200 [Candidatus Riflebacteria bacterium]|nr:hypothetical protein [Candidatus Riflebacteria bacterium]
MKIDAKTLETIVREVVERLLAQHPELFASSAPDDPVVEHRGRLLSEGDLLTCRKQGKRAIRLDRKTIVTPLARDRAKDLGIRVVFRD